MSVLSLLTAGLLTTGATLERHAEAVTAPPAPGTYAVSWTPISLTQPTDPQYGTITPTANASTKGMFAPMVGWPVIPLHAALATNGHLVSFGTPVGQATQGGLAFDDWNPFAGGVHGDTATMNYDSFCNSLTRLADGTMLMVGGNSTMTSMIYDPVSRTQTPEAALRYPRWYNTTLRLPDNRILVLGGATAADLGAYHTPNDNSQIATVPEIGTGTGAWTALPGAASTVAFGAVSNHWWYPRAFNAPNGTVFGVSGDQLWTLDPSGSGHLTLLGTLPFSIGVSGSQVMYSPGHILFAGGGQNENQDTIWGANAAATVDLTSGTPVVTAVAPMAYRRNWLNLTVLPTGEVFANGGTFVGTESGASNSDYTSEIWNPATQRWRKAATATRVRTYHSTSLLLPDGAVFTGGGGVPGPEDNFNAEIYYPPYLFTKGADGVTRWANRDTIAGMSGNLTYGGKVTLRMADTRTIHSVSLITLASVTHSENTDQRRVGVTFTQDGARLSLHIRSDRNQLPPGSYLLQAVDSAGVPTPGQIVTIEPGQAGKVTVYESVTTAAH